MPATKGLLFKRYIRIELNLWRRTLFEIITMLIMVLVILLNPIAHSRRLLYTSHEHENEQSIVSHKLQDINILTRMADSKREKTKYSLAYTPKTPFTTDVARSVAKTLELNSTVGYRLESEMQDQFDERTTLAGIVFHEASRGGTPLKLSISIRFPSEFRTIAPFLTEDRLWITRCSGRINPGRDQAKHYKQQDLYIREGFLQLQHQIFVEWYHRLRTDFITTYPEPNVEVYNILLNAADEPCSVMSIARLPTFLYNFIYLLPFLNIIRNVAAQVEDGVMVHQWHYGYSFGLQWGFKFMVLFLRMLILGALFLIMVLLFWAFGGRDGEFSGKGMIAFICFIVVYTVEIVITGMVVAKLFANPTNAVLFALLLWLFMYAAFCIILERYWDIHKYYVFFILVAFCNCQMHFSMSLFRNCIDDPDRVQTIDFVVLFTSAISSALIYLLILLAVQWRMPGTFLSRRIVNNRPRKQKESDATIMYLGRAPSFQNFEFGDVGSEELMRLRHVSTTHRDSERKILKNISMRIYRGEIYVILGHIGSGKLTLLRILAGLKFPLRGSVSILGKPFQPYGETRRMVDFRFDEHGLNKHLTVEQTIDYHVRLKLAPNESDRYEIERRKWLAILDQHVESRRTRIGKLGSGAMKLVALCCCLAGDTRIIILEEPTIPLTGREAQVFWSIVNAEKDNRAFIIATYSVGEAEHAADRIGILSMGVLEASGTPFFLRAKFSSSVDLVLIKKPHVPDQPITDYINQFVTNIEPENEIGDTLTYRIPVIFRPRLQKLLIHLEIDRKMLGIENVRVVGAELSDIYMKLVTSFRLQQQMIPDVTQTFKYQVVSHTQLTRQRMRAMFYKKMIHTAPNVWPIIMIFTSFVLIAIIARLSVLLDMPKVRQNTIHIGFMEAADVSKTIPNLKKCGYIDIKPTVKGAKKLPIETSRTFNAKSFACEKGSYRNDLKKKNEMRSYGAVEADGEQELNGYISQDFFHSAPMMLNLLHNIILRLSYPEQQNIVALVENHPLPTQLSRKINLLDNKIAHIHAPLTIGCILPLTVSVFVIPLVEEQIYNVRFLQHMAGLGLKVFWGVNLFWDWFTFFIYSVIIVVIMSLMGIGGFGFTENAILLLLLCIFGLAALPLTYLVSMFVNKSLVRAFLVSVLLQGVSGLVLYMIYWDVANSNTIFFYGACMSPGFSLLDGVSNVYTQRLEQEICNAKCQAHISCTKENMHEVVPNCRFGTHFKWAAPGILPAIVFMLVSALIFLMLIFWIELHRREKKFHTPRDLRKMRTATYPFDDGDVADVKLKIAEADNTKAKQSVFLVDQVEAKVPTSGKRINTVSFALNKYMSMGIFGPRNSGKSHLMRQLVGEEGFAFGEIYVRGLDFKYDLESIHTYMGYCPQHRGLLNELTPREHIRLLCMIRGVPEAKIGEKMHDLCLMLNMTGWMHRKCSLLTAEKRTKLKIALALVAYNKILVLDEPTCGMPATTRREIWNILRYIRYCGKTIIFATNDELECKILADFIILFQDSEMLAIGSLQYLRYKYSHGFYLEVRLIRDGATLAESEENLRKDVDNLAKFVNFLHNRSELVARLHNWFKFYVPVGQIVYSFLYGAMEKNKVRLNVSDYCIYQADMINVVAQVQETRAQLKHHLVQTEGPLPLDTTITKKGAKAKGKK
ncbi:ATP-binding cassette sub-family A member 2 [Drosophila subpulchrella]|uniref:ATP-binding cassette sub-family A member 2 n=1 Tax=Drosophila subpulchrella TaxID=1486046 RepID=UPI0018A17C84|nr:ATP-binding cassette sub-family A member 2 [Drosophila subpulchrella]